MCWGEAPELVPGGHTCSQGRLAEPPRRVVAANRQHKLIRLAGLPVPVPVLPASPAGVGIHPGVWLKGGWLELEMVHRWRLNGTWGMAEGWLAGAGWLELAGWSWLAGAIMVLWLETKRYHRTACRQPRGPSPAAASWHTAGLQNRMLMPTGAGFLDNYKLPTAQGCKTSQYSRISSDVDKQTRQLDLP